MIRASDFVPVDQVAVACRSCLESILLSDSMTYNAYCWAWGRVSASARRTPFANSYHLNAIPEPNIEVEASLPWHIAVLNCLIAAAQPLCLPLHLAHK